MTTNVMPKAVIWYERLSYLGVALTAASLPLNWVTVSRLWNKYPLSYWPMVVIVFAIEMFWIWLVARKRKNWARWISAIFMILAIPSEIWNFSDRYQAAPFAEITFCCVDVIWSVAVILLFSPDSKPWFDADNRFVADSTP